MPDKKNITVEEIIEVAERQRDVSETEGRMTARDQWEAIAALGQFYADVTNAHATALVKITEEAQTVINILNEGVSKINGTFTDLEKRIEALENLKGESD